MSKPAAKFAVSLPAELYEQIEEERHAEGLGRSEYVVVALRDYLVRKRERALVEQYVRGYTEQPETADEFGVNDQLIAAVFAENPWEEA